MFTYIRGKKAVSEDMKLHIINVSEFLLLNVHGGKKAY